MSASDKVNKFLKLAKAIPLNEQGPSGFSKRIMVKVREQNSRETTMADERFLRFARNISENQHTPYKFEKRIMALVLDWKTENPFTVWSRVLWRAVAPCIGIMVLTAFIAFNQDAPITDSQPWLSMDNPEENFEIDTTDFETVMLASFDELEYTW